jgi:hypothetical protein
MIEVSFENLLTITAEDAQNLTGVDAVKFNQPGIYHVLIGSRSEIEEFEFIGEVNSVKLPTVEELVAEYDARDDEDRQDYADLIDEFYGIGIEEDHINFGYTEEGYDVWVRI